MKIRSPLLNRLLCSIAVFAFKLLFRTCRIKVQTEDPDYTPYGNDSGTYYIFSIWHDSLLFPLFIRRPPKFVALVGPHRDGGYVTNIIKSLGFDSVRGSSSQGGTRAVLQIIEKSRGRNLSITPDGPRGPRRQMKSGCAYLSGQTGKPVLATAFSSSNCWRIRGRWTDLVIPKPFSTIYILTSKPIYVPQHASKEEVDDYTSIIQQEMDRINELAENLAEGQAVSFDSVPPSRSRRAAA